MPTHDDGDINEELRSILQNGSPTTDDEASTRRMNNTHIMDELESAQIGWASVLAATYKKLIDGGLPECFVAVLVRDNNWVFNCRVNGYLGETPIPPGDYGQN